MPRIDMKQFFRVALYVLFLCETTLLSPFVPSDVSRYASQCHNNTAVKSATAETYSIKHILVYSWACRSRFSSNNACGEEKRAGTSDLSYLILIASGSKVSRFLYVLLTVRLSIILAIDQLKAQILV